MLPGASPLPYAFAWSHRSGARSCDERALGVDFGQPRLNISVSAVGRGGGRSPAFPALWVRWVTMAASTPLVWAGKWKSGETGRLVNLGRLPSV